jgi:hypothetical protein
MKDECAGKPAIEFVGLRSKMYSLLLDKDETDERVKMTAKGVLLLNVCVTTCI